MSTNHILSAGNIEIDLSIIFELTDNENDFTMLMVQTFINNSPVLVTRMKDALEKEDWEEVYKAAHFAKSSLSVFRINGLLDLVQTLEAAARQKKDLEDIPGMINAFDLKITGALELLSSHFIK